MTVVVAVAGLLHRLGFQQQGGQSRGVSNIFLRAFGCTFYHILEIQCLGGDAGGAVDSCRYRLEGWRVAVSACGRIWSRRRTRPEYVSFLVPAMDCER